MIDWFLETLRGLDGTQAYLMVLGVLGLCGLGLPMPEDIILITAGYLSALGKFSLWSAVLAGMVGVLSGDAVLFFLGRHYGRRVFNLPFVQRMFSEEKLAQAQHRIQANARFICFIARFLPGLRSPIYLTAGAMQIPPQTYIMQDGMAAAISVPFWVIFGWWFGPSIESALIAAKEFQMYFLLIAGVAVAIWAWRNLRQPLEPPPSA